VCHLRARVLNSTHFLVLVLRNYLFLLVKLIAIILRVFMPALPTPPITTGASSTISPTPPS
jgi:hypothetical protein